jgi:hypothetical protein
MWLATKKCPAINRSVSCDYRLVPSETIVHAKFDCMNVQGATRDARRGERREVVLTEVMRKEIFALNRHVRQNAVFDTAADCVATVRLGVADEAAGATNLDIVACSSEAALPVD